MLPLAEFAYNNSTQASTGASPFFAMYSYYSQIQYDVEDNNHKEEVLTANKQVKQIHDICKVLSECWANVVEMQVKYYNKKHTLQLYVVSDLVMLSMKNLQQKRLNQKLFHKFIEPFRVHDIIEKQAYQLILPSSYQIHDVFHVSYLELYTR